MSSNSLVVEVKNEVPKSFIRGQDLEFLMDLPPDVPAKFFGDPAPASPVVATALSCELRRKENAGEGGFIATLAVTWDDADCTRLRFKASDTDEWPLGPAEFNVKFVRTSTPAAPAQPTVKTFKSLPVTIVIADGVTA